MSDWNHQFGEVANVVPNFGPVDMSAAANSGIWVSVEEYEKVVMYLVSAAGTAGDDPVVTVTQATNKSGAGAKALDYSRYRVRSGSSLAALPGVDTLVTFTSTEVNTTTLTGLAADYKQFYVEITGSDLDVVNGFTHVNFAVAQCAHAQLGYSAYIMYAAAHPQSIPVSPLT